MNSGKQVSVPRDPKPITTSLDYYPEGKTIRHLTLFTIQGTGKNEFWFINEELNFVYEYRVLAETKCLENTGQHATFLVDFKAVDEIRASSRHKLRWRDFDSPLLAAMWPQMDRQLDLIPAYRLWRVLDPDGDQTLAVLEKLYGGLRSLLGLNGKDEVEIESRVKSLAGHKFQLVYAPDYGIQSIEIVSGPEMRADELIELAQRSGLVVDGLLMDALKDRRVGDQFNIDVSSIGNKIGVGYDLACKGAIRVKRGNDEGDLRVLEVGGGEIEVFANANRHGRLRPMSGVIWVDPNSYFVKKARFEITGSTDWIDESHLLFNVKSLRGVSVSSYYEAELVKN